MARPGESKTSEHRITAKERAAEALNLRRAGADYRTIATRLGYKSVSGAYDAVAKALKEITREPAEAVLELELDRIDRLFLTYWPKATGGDVKALDRVVKLMERRAKLLGLDAPVKQEFSGGVGLALDFAGIDVPLPDRDDDPTDLGAL